MIRAVIFDLDGVVVDSRDVWFETFNEAAAKFGYQYSKDLDHLTRGVGVIKASENLTSHFGIPNKNGEFLNLCNEVYKNIFFKHASLMPGVLNLLERLNGHFKLALASSSPRFVIKQNFEKFPQLEQYFKVSVAGDEVENTKPAPDIFLKAAQMLNINPKNCLVIEDSPSGMAAAKSAGMFCIALADPGPKKQNTSKADRVVEKLSGVDQSLINSLA